MINRDAKKRKFVLKLGIYLGLGLISLIYVFPIYWVFVTSISGFKELMFEPPKIFPNAPTIEHYTYVILSSKYLIFLKNSLFVSILVTILTLIISACSAYALSDVRFYGKYFFSKIILLVYFFPGILLIIPLFQMAQKVGLYDNLISVAIVNILMTLPFSIWTLKLYFDDIPEEISEAAKIDGCSRFGILYRIFLPLVLPGLATVAIYSFVVSWNDFLFPAVLISNIDHQTLAVGIAGWTSSYSINWGQIAAASIMTIIPVVIFFASVGKLFIKGLTGGAVKG